MAVLYHLARLTYEAADVGLSTELEHYSARVSGVEAIAQSRWPVRILTPNPAFPLPAPPSRSPKVFGVVLVRIEIVGESTPPPLSFTAPCRSPLHGGTSFGSGRWIFEAR